jgi:hypothetical protein
MKGIFLLDAGDDDHLDDTPDDVCNVEISLHAMIGSCTNETIHLPVLMHNQTLATLVDYGYTHCFMAAEVMRRLNRRPIAKDGMTVGVTNGERLDCLGVCSMLTFSIHDELFCIDFLVIALEGYEVVLRCNWLCSLGPIVWDFSRLSMVF